jgi:hypothetical protein
VELGWNDQIQLGLGVFLMSFGLWLVMKTEFNDVAEMTLFGNSSPTDHQNKPFRTCKPLRFRRKHEAFHDTASNRL